MKTNKIIALMISIVLVVVLFASCSSNTEITETTANNDVTTTTQPYVHSDSDFDNISANGVLKIGVIENKPFTYKDENGQWIGLDIDYANLIAKELGLKTEFVEIEWSKRYLDLDSYKIDCIWSGLPVTDQVRSKCEISSKYAKGVQVVVTKKDTFNKYKDKKTLKKAKIAACKGSISFNLAKGISSKVKGYNSPIEALQSVKDGKNTACVISSISADSLLVEDGEFSDLGYQIELSTEKYAVGFRMGSDMSEKFENAKTNLINDKALSSVYEKYSIEPEGEIE